jgi:hypothetical protein
VNVEINQKLRLNWLYIKLNNKSWIRKNGAAILLKNFTQIVDWKKWSLELKRKSCNNVKNERIIDHGD